MCCLPDACIHTESRDGNIRYDEYENDNLFPLVEYKTYDPQRGMCFLPRRGLNVAEFEIARAFKVAASSIEAIAFIVLCRVCSQTPAPLSRMFTLLLQSDSLQSDIFLLCHLSSLLCPQSITSAGKPAPPKLVVQELAPAPTSTPAPAPIRQMSRQVKANTRKAAA